MDRIAVHLGLASHVAIGLALVALIVVPGVVRADGGTIAFASDTTWQVTDANDAVGPALDLPGSAQTICLNGSAPPNCPADAVLYGFPSFAWGADLSSIPGASWIWAPGVTGTTSPADEDAYDFSKTINVPGTPISGTISVGADDSAEVSVNGQSAGSISGFGALTTIDITTLLVEGPNEIVVRGINALYCGAPCPYEVNPAGVVFGGEIAYAAPAATETPPPTAAPVVTSQPEEPTPEASPPTATADSPPAAESGDVAGAAPLIALAAALALIAAAFLALILFRRRRTDRDSTS